MLAIIFLSLAFETTQLLTGLGVFDVDDIILNTSGGALGYIIYAIIKKAIGVAARKIPENTA